MSLPVMVAEQLIMAVLLNGTGDSGKKSRAGLGLMALALVLAFAGIGFLIVSGYHFLLERYDVKTAALFMAGMMLACAVAMSSVGYALMHYRQKRANSYRQTISDNIRALVSSLGDELEGPIRDNPKTAALLAGLAGFTAAQKFH